jgi:hypothetical protein
MNLGLSGPIESRRAEVVKVRDTVGIVCGSLHLVRELNELRDIDGGIVIRQSTQIATEENVNESRRSRK